MQMCTLNSGVPSKYFEGSRRLFILCFHLFKINRNPEMHNKPFHSVESTRTNRVQQNFFDLDMKLADDDDSSCGSAPSSLGSFNSSMASGLTFTDLDHTEGPKERPFFGVCATKSGGKIAMGRNAASKGNGPINLVPSDFAWLQIRCDGDTQLVFEVLRCFCEQGQTHLQAMQSSMENMDKPMLVFHAVRFFVEPI